MKQVSSGICIELDRETAFKSVARTLEHGHTIFKYDKFGIIPALFFATDELALTSERQSGATAAEYLDLVVMPFCNGLADRGVDSLTVEDIMSFNSYGCRPFQTFTTESMGGEGHFATLDYLEAFFYSSQAVFRDIVGVVDLLEPALELSRGNYNEIGAMREVYYLDNNDEISPMQIYHEWHKSKPEKFSPLLTRLAFNEEQDDSERWVQFFSDNGFELKDWQILQGLLLDEVSKIGNNERQVFTRRVVMSPFVQAFTEANYEDRTRKLTLDRMLARVNKMISEEEPNYKASADVVNDKRFG